MCGFFSAVGLLLWKLAFSVDTGENKFISLMLSSDWSLIQRSLLHHVPSLVAGSGMHVLSRSYPALTPVMLALTVLIAYLFMLVTSVTLSEAQNDGWFWTKEDFQYNDVPGLGHSNIMEIQWMPPFPFGVVRAILEGRLHYRSLVKGLPVSFAMAAIYLVRCSLHAPALIKNSKELNSWKDQRNQLNNIAPLQNILSNHQTSEPNGYGQLPHVSFGDDNNCDDDDAVDFDSNAAANGKKNAPMTTSRIMLWYGNGLIVSGIIGGTACLPSIAAAITLFKVCCSTCLIAGGEYSSFSS